MKHTIKKVTTSYYSYMGDTESVNINVNEESPTKMIQVKVDGEMWRTFQGAKRYFSELIKKIEEVEKLYTK